MAEYVEEHPDSNDEHAMLEYYNTKIDRQTYEKLVAVLRKEELLSFVDEIACLHYAQLVESDSCLYGPV